MIRTLFDVPGPVDYKLLTTQLRAADLLCVDCNDVDGRIAVYSDVALDASAVAAVIAVHAGPLPFPPLDPTGALATLLVVEGVLPLSDAANAIHEEPAHLEHEALAWSVG